MKWRFCINKYLLYIDILGFRDLVKTNPEKVEQIFDVLNSLVLHHHHSFNKIVFSDTVLVYNNFDIHNNDEHIYSIMYLIEFCQNLMSFCAGKNIFFRAFIDYGTFIHHKMDNLEKYYGETLINCYDAEKTTNSIGVFVSNIVTKYQIYFPMEKFSKDWNFVFLKKDLLELNKWIYPSMKESINIFFEGCDFYEFANDFLIIENIYTFSLTIEDSKIRQKFQTYWFFYLNKYPKLMRLLQDSQFDINLIFDGARKEDITNLQLIINEVKES